MSIGQSVVYINPKRQLFAAEAAARLMDAKRTTELPLFQSVSAAADKAGSSTDSRSAPFRAQAR